MSDRYDEGYTRAEKVYRRRFNFRYELLHDTKQVWEKPSRQQFRHAITAKWPELAKQLDAISDQAEKMPGEYR